MIQLKTMLNCIDNSVHLPSSSRNLPRAYQLTTLRIQGAAIVECAKVLGMKRHAAIGDRIVIVVQKQRSLGTADLAGGAQAAAQKVRRGDIRHAVVVRTKKKYQRPDGSVVKFEDNACVLINKGGEPIGTRLNGVVGKELRAKQWSKILSLAPAHV